MAELYWACITYTRSWWATDGPRLARTRKGLDHKSLRAIALEYNVNRGVPKGVESAQKLADFLNKAGKIWPGGLTARAERCLEIVAQARSAGRLKTNQISGTTKFMWFLKPDGWTVFDRFAADGAGIPKHLNAMKRMERFYRQLEEWDFEAKAADMQAVIDDSPLAGMPAPRILDRLLMARAGDYQRDAPDELQAFVDLLPSSASKLVVELSDQLQSRFGDDVLGERA